jgi:hypothetical protein
MFLLIIRLQIVACTKLFTVDVFGGFGVALSDWAAAVEADLSVSPGLWRLLMCIRCIFFGYDLKEGCCAYFACNASLWIQLYVAVAGPLGV